ncbi:MAG: hydrolase, partial [Oscillibacter sp.]
FPLGHGEKSLYQIVRYMDLNPCEALAIRWHMGAYDSAAKSDSRPMSAAMELSPWVWRLQEADMCAAWIDEREEKQQ